MRTSAPLCKTQQAEAPPFDFENNPYKAKRPWPPDFSQLSEKYQFRLERKYRRRSSMRYLRPGWMKGTKLLQWGLGSAVLVYGVLFYDWKLSGHEPFGPVRRWYRENVASIWSVPANPRSTTREIPVNRPG